jgi:hypothetical protein
MVAGFRDEQTAVGIHYATAYLSQFGGGCLAAIARISDKPRAGERGKRSARAETRYAAAKWRGIQETASDCGDGKLRMRRRRQQEYRDRRLQKHLFLTKQRAQMTYVDHPVQTFECGTVPGD